MGKMTKEGLLEIVQLSGQGWSALAEFHAQITADAKASEGEACATLARKDVEYYTGLYKITKQKRWREAADAAEVIALNIEARLNRMAAA